VTQSDLLPLLRAALVATPLLATADPAYARLRAPLAAAASQIPEIATARQEVEDRGHALLRFPVDLEPMLSALLSVVVLEVWGEPTQTSPSSDCLAWPIQARPGTERPTFSQTSEEASFHTDTQYYPHPERWFGLYSVVSDRSGLGSSLLVDGLAVYETLSPDTQFELQRPYPFRVPALFTADGRPDTVELLWRPIWDGSILRWREDTLLAACELVGEQVSADQLRAARDFAAALREAEPVTLHLEPGMMLVVDNHRMLHARTSFESLDRLLYRVRVRQAS
jgi:Taurine catabolism dioxygenase TauD, TfdA family